MHQAIHSLLPLPRSKTLDQSSRPASCPGPPAVPPVITQHPDVTVRAAAWGGTHLA